MSLSWAVSRMGYQISVLLGQHPCPNWRQNLLFPAINQPPTSASLEKHTRPRTLPTTRVTEPQFNLAKANQEINQMGKGKQYWLLKTEPGEWSWDDQASNGGITNWDGVKNKQAQKNLKAMKLNDLCFFYHSGVSARRVVGVVTVVKEWYSKGDDEVIVDVKAVGEMRRPVDLKEMKRDEGLSGFALFKQPRLSVVPVPKEVWERLCELGGGFEGDGKDDCGANDNEGED